MGIKCFKREHVPSGVVDYCICDSDNPITLEVDGDFIYTEQSVEKVIHEQYGGTAWLSTYCDLAQ